MVARTAVYALGDIADEIDKLGEPANPGLVSNLRNAVKVLDGGGTLYGYYGSGKSLISLLYSIYKTLSGEPTLVLEAYAVLRLNGELKLGDISPTLASLNILKSRTVDGKSVGELIVKWLTEIDSSIGSVQVSELVNRLTKLRDVSVSVTNKGLERLLELARILQNNNDIRHIVFDEFERLVANPTAYGYNTRGDLLEDLFMFADRKEPSIALSIPHTLRGMLDLEIIARLQPMIQIIYEEDELWDLFEKFTMIRAEPELVEKLVEELRELGLSFKVPRAVVTLASEAIRAKSLIELALERTKFLCLASYNYPTRSARRRALLAIFYTYVWLRQDAYSPVDEERIRAAKGRICSLLLSALKDLKITGKVADYVKEICDTLKPKDILAEARRLGVLERVGTIYILSLNAVTNLVSAITGQLADIASRNYGIRFEPKSLLVELQLYGRE